jgi:hypothetical protein
MEKQFWQIQVVAIWSKQLPSKLAGNKKQAGELEEWAASAFAAI